ncbi:MAG TPA: copper-binding protein [Candidatus Acidoferrales bacterium]|nr:copper-binding protein [Candidatus Acidoferrales bacterium]
MAIYRSYFIALAVLALAYSFFVAMRKKHRAGMLSVKKYRFGRDDFILLLTAALVVLAISFPYIRGVTVAESGAVYDGRGSVVSVDSSGTKITVKHEAIEGLMPAMTMEFLLRSPELVKAIRPGDRVSFVLAPEGSDFVIENIARDEKKGKK